MTKYFCDVCKKECYSAPDSRLLTCNVEMCDDCSAKLNALTRKLHYNFLKSGGKIDV